MNSVTYQEVLYPRDVWIEVIFEEMLPTTLFFDLKNGDHGLVRVKIKKVLNHFCFFDENNDGVARSSSIFGIGVPS